MPQQAYRKISFYCVSRDNPAQIFPPMALHS